MVRDFFIILLGRNALQFIDKVSFWYELDELSDVVGFGGKFQYSVILLLCDDSVCT